MTREPMYDALEAMWRDRDPVPEGLVDRMRVVAAAEAALRDTDLDYELMLLIERSSELAGTRGATTGHSAYTMTFSAEGLDLMVRIAPGEDGTARIDGWIVPPGPVTVRATRVGEPGDAGAETEVDAQGRFELTSLPSGLYRLWVVPREDDVQDSRAFGTPAFEI